MPPSLLLAGPEGVGKKTLALALAQAILCERAPVAEACGELPDLPPRRGGPRAGEARGAARRGGSPSRRGRLAQLPRPPRPGARRGLEAHEDGPTAGGARDPGRPGARPDRRDRGHALRGAPARVRDRRRAHDERVGAERAAEEPRGASAALARPARDRRRRSACGRRSARAASSSASVRCRARRSQAVLLERGGLSEDEARLRAGLAGGSVGAALAFESEQYRQHPRERCSGCSSDWTAWTRSGAWRPPSSWSRRRTPALLLTILRSLLRDVAALRAGGRAAALGNADVAPTAGRARASGRSGSVRRRSPSASASVALVAARVREPPADLRRARRRAGDGLSAAPQSIRFLRPSRRRCATRYAKSPPLEEP